jgi:hypothetical protein
MSKSRIAFIAAAIAGILTAALALEVITTQPVRGAMRTCSELFTLANRPGLTDSERIEAARALCSARYLQNHPLVVAPGEGLVGIPRNINKNFQAWREGSNVWICPTNRVGPIYQFVHEGGRWRFDGPAGILRPWGEIVKTSELTEPLPD